MAGIGQLPVTRPVLINYKHCRLKKLKPQRRTINNPGRNPGLMTYVRPCAASISIAKEKKVFAAQIKYFPGKTNN